jgi:succinate-acetate transporter protein
MEGGLDGKGLSVTIAKFPDMYGKTGPLGLLGFGLTTILLSVHNLGLFGNSAMIMGMAIFYGGLAQFVAGCFEFSKGHTFSGVAFISYASFWWSLTFIWIGPKLTGAEAPNSAAMGTYLLIWGIFTGVMFIATLKGGVCLKVVFGTLTVTFLLLAIGDFAESKNVTRVGGGFGLLCGVVAMYTGLVEIIDHEVGWTRGWY